MLILVLFFRMTNDHPPVSLLFCPYFFPKAVRKTFYFVIYIIIVINTNNWQELGNLLNDKISLTIQHCAIYQRTCFPQKHRVAEN